MIDKKKVIEYMESIYRYFPHIEFIGIDLNGEMIFTVKAKGHCFITSDKLQRTTCENCGRKYQKYTPSAVDKVYKGERHGKLTIIKAAYIYDPEDITIDKPSLYQRVICQCDCGNFIIPRLSTVLNGKSKSCGCCDKNRKPKVPYPYDLSFYEMEYKK